METWIDQTRCGARSLEIGVVITERHLIAPVHGDPAPMAAGGAATGRA